MPALTKIVTLYRKIELHGVNIIIDYEYFLTFVLTTGKVRSLGTR